MKFDKNVNKFLDYLAEDHDEQFDAYLKEMGVSELLDQLGADRGNPELYQNLERWIKETYPDHIMSAEEDPFRPDAEADIEETL